MSTDDILNRAEWTERIVAVANNVIDENEDSFSNNREKSFFEDIVLDKVEGYLKGSAVLHTARYEFVKYTAVKDIPRDLWTDAKDWDDVLYGVSYHCACFDVTKMVMRILSDEAPRRKSPVSLDE